MSDLIKTTLISSGKQVKVYPSKVRDTFIDFADCKTEYKASELNLKNK